MKKSLAEKRAAYRATFCGELPDPHPIGSIVLADLRSFCGIADNKALLKVSRASGMVDPHATIYNLGRVEVYLRIVKMLGLDVATQPNEEPSDDRSAATAEQ